LGAVAQLVAHLVRNEGVRGSNPLSSTFSFRFLSPSGALPHPERRLASPRVVRSLTSSGSFAHLRTRHASLVSSIRTQQISLGQEVAMAKAARASAPLTLVVSGKAEEFYSSALLVERLVGLVGSNALAGLIGVSTSQPSRWRSGKEKISAENRRRLTDLDFILDRLQLELYPDQIGPWLLGSNAHLGGARPIDVLRLKGPASVLPAIDALVTGAFA
jgi:transcriptional regulator with XRE-family HTH domain